MCGGCSPACVTKRATCLEVEEQLPEQAQGSFPMALCNILRTHIRAAPVGLWPRDSLCSKLEQVHPTSTIWQRGIARHAVNDNILRQ